MSAHPESINWYRTPIDRGLLRELSQKSDRRAWFQVVGHLTALAISGSVTVWALNSSFPPVAIIPLFIHGCIMSMLGWTGASHELNHNSVFNTKWLNGFFLKLFAFMTWNNPVLFRRSHARHHAYTLHAPLDQEVNAHREITKRQWASYWTINLHDFYRTARAHYFNARGIITGGWAQLLFPEADDSGRNKMSRWSLTLLSGHAVLALVFLLSGFWEGLLIFTLASRIGNVFAVALAEMQHRGCIDGSKDFRENSRTILLEPLFAFFYWNMNYHIEHHMYPQIPFYNLPRLRREIESDLPSAPRGLVASIMVSFFPQTA